MSGSCRGGTYRGATQRGGTYTGRGGKYNNNTKRNVAKPDPVVPITTEHYFNHCRKNFFKNFTRFADGAMFKYEENLPQITDANHTQIASRNANGQSVHDFCSLINFYSKSIYLIITLNIYIFYHKAPYCQNLFRASSNASLLNFVISKKS